MRRHPNTMYYWNQDNFQSLLELAKTLEPVPGLEPLAAYCVLREQGLRAQAFEKLRHFLADTAQWTAQQARENVLVILQADARAPAAHQFMVAPLLQQFVYPTLERWLADEPSAVAPQRWLGLLRGDAEMLRAALAREPADVVVRSKLIGFALDAADYATHHLSESILLQPVSDVREAIALARQLIEAAPDAEPFAHFVAEANTYDQMLDDWVAYQAAKDVSFPDWCRAKGRSYAWCTAVYYQT